MIAPLHYLPIATAAASLGSAAAARIGQGFQAAGSSFAALLAGDQTSEVTGKVAAESGQSQLGSLLEKLQTALRDKLQSLGLRIESELTLRCDDGGQIDAHGDPDSAALIEQLFQTDGGLQQQLANLLRAYDAEGEQPSNRLTLLLSGDQLQILPAD